MTMGEDWGMTDAAVRAIIDDHAQLHAGEEPYIHENTVATPAQWIWLWNRATPEKRLAVAEAIERDADTARACYFGSHVHRLIEVQNTWHEGPGRAQAAVSMILALASELDDGCPWSSNAPDIADQIRKVIDEAMNGPAPVLIPSTSTPPPALLETTRFPVPAGEEQQA
jgi:hypothetical protein